MQFTRALPVLAGLGVAVAVACSDSSPAAPETPLTTLTSGQTDTGKAPPPTNPTAPKPDSTAPKPDSGQTTPPTNPRPTGPDTGGIKASNEPRLVSGVIMGVGPASDSASFTKIAGAVVTWTAFDGKELARATTAADGSYSLGSYVPASYMFKVTPPANSPFRGVEWAFIISPYSTAKIDLTVVLGRK